MNMRRAAFIAVAVACSAVLGRPALAEPNFETFLLLKPSKETGIIRYGEGDIIELKDGSLALLYSRFTDWHDNSPGPIVMRTSSDNGQTWSDERIMVPREEAKQNVMSVSLIRERESGDILFFYLRTNSINDAQPYVRRSSDELKTLSDPVRVAPDEGYVIMHNDRAIQISSGRILLPCNGMTIFKEEDGKKVPEFFRSGAAKVYYSDDGGHTWQGDNSTIEPKEITQHEPCIVELKDGRLAMYMRTVQGAIYQCFSEDQGESWSKPEPTPLKSPEAPCTIERVPWTGDLVCVWNDHTGYHALPRTIRSPLCLALSHDEGKTWTYSRVLEAAPPSDDWRSVEDSYYSYTSMTWVDDRMILSYWDMEKHANGDRFYGLRVKAFNREWLYWDK